MRQAAGSAAKPGAMHMRGSLARWGLAALLLCLATALIACGSESTPPEDDAPAQAGDSGASSGDAGAGSGADAVVSYANPNGQPTALDTSMNKVLASSVPRGMVAWTSGPTIGGGALEASGRLEQGATLFAPEAEDGGYAFAVHYKDMEGLDEPLAVLLPDRGAMFIWDTDHTVAEMDYELEGTEFSFRAYSPLFMDTGAGDLVLHTYGYDAENEPALLDVHPIG